MLFAIIAAGPGPVRAVPTGPAPGIAAAATAAPAPADAASALLVACAAGDRAALGRLYAAEAPRLFGVALRIVRRRDLAHDVLHDAFVRIWQRAAGFDPARGPARAWMTAVVRNGALNLVRDGRFEAELDEARLETLADPADPAPLLLERLAEHAALRRCLEALEPARRGAILLAYAEGLSHAEVADRLRAPLGTVKAWIRRGLLALRECLS